MADDIETISSTVLDRMKDICDNKDTSLQEKLFKEYSRCKLGL